MATGGLDAKGQIVGGDSWAPIDVPIIRLVPPSVNHVRTQRLAELVGVNPADLVTDPATQDVSAYGEQASFEVRADGAHWFAVRDRATPSGPALQLMTQAEAVDRSLAFIEEAGFTRRSIDGVGVAPRVIVPAKPCPGRLKVVYRLFDHPKKPVIESEECLDVYVAHVPELRVTDPAASMSFVADVIGRGAKTAFSYGRSEELLDFHHHWRDLDQVVERVPLISWARTSAAFRELCESIEIEDHVATVVYRLVEIDGVSHLSPYWLHQATGVISGRRFQLRDVSLSAVELNPDPPALKAQSPRKPATLPFETTEEWITGATWVTKGASNAAGEAQAFLDAMRSAGWGIRYAWGDKNVFPDDWKKDNDAWVDAVDMAYYTGHAYAGGWQLRGLQWLEIPDAGLIREIKGDVYGQRLKWLVISSCGPLQDCHITPGESSVATWAGIFDGLRLLLGFATAIGGGNGEGVRFLESARKGMPLPEAWRHAARERQPSCSPGDTVVTRWAAVLAVETNHTSTLEDVIPERRHQLQSVARPDRLVAIWSPA